MTSVLPYPGRSSRTHALYRLVFGTLYLFVILPVVLLVFGTFILLYGVWSIGWALTLGKREPTGYKWQRYVRAVLVNITDNLEFIIAGNKGFYPIPIIDFAIVPRS